MTYTVHRFGFFPIWFGRATKDCFQSLFVLFADLLILFAVVPHLPGEGI